MRLPQPTLPRTALGEAPGRLHRWQESRLSCRPGACRSLCSTDTHGRLHRLRNDLKPTWRPLGDTGKLVETHAQTGTQPSFLYGQQAAAQENRRGPLGEVTPHTAKETLVVLRPDHQRAVSEEGQGTGPGRGHRLRGGACRWGDTSSAPGQCQRGSTRAYVLRIPCSDELRGRAVSGGAACLAAHLSWWMMRLIASKSTAFLALECCTFLDFGGSWALFRIVSRHSVRRPRTAGSSGQDRKPSGRLPAHLALPAARLGPEHQVTSHWEKAAATYRRSNRPAI